jgi:hypothetical protein
MPRHGRRAGLGAHLTALEALLGLPWAIEHGGGHRLVGDLTVGEMSAARRLPCPV